MKKTQQQSIYEFIGVEICNFRMMLYNMHLNCDLQL